MVYRNLRRSGTPTDIIKSLIEAEQQALSEREPEDAVQIEHGRVDFEGYALEDTYIVGENAVSDNEGYALQDSHDQSEKLSGTFKTAEGKALVDYWLRFDNDLTDYSGNGNDASLVAGVEKYGMGSHRRAVEFDGSTRYSLPENAKTQISSAFSIAFWLKGPASLAQDATFDQRIMEVYVDANNDLNISVTAGGQIRTRIRRAGVTAQAATTSAQVFAGERHLYIIVYNGTTITIYVDGSSVGTTSASNSPDTTTGVRIGWRTSTTGRLGAGARLELRRYNFALNGTQAQNLFSTRLFGGSIYDPPMCTNFSDVGV